MKHYLHYIWDFDGTLFDSYPHSTAALCATAARFGVSLDPAEVSRALRHSFAEGYALSGLDREQLKLFHQLRGDDAFPPPIVPFPNAARVLEALSARGAKHYLYTHSKRKMSVRFIEKFGLDKWFAGYVTPDDPGFAQKPDPGAIRYILEHWRIDPASAAMVGDRDIDLRCASAAGIDGILVDPDRLAGSELATSRVDDLIELI